MSTNGCEGPVLSTVTLTRATPLTFVVRGTPGPQGSKRHVGNGRLIESSRKVKPWREAVRAAATALIAPYGDDWQPLDVPLVARMVFALRRPQRPKASRPDRYPDLSKLVRSTEDALTGVLWTDDARVVEYDRLAKIYVPEGLDGPGALITVWEA
jgi:Holliday junction resolvase RusA-like endonuclease